MNDRKKGFTLIELLAVIIVISVIAMITVPMASKYITDSKKQSFLVGVEHIMTAMKEDQAKQDFIALTYTFPLTTDTTLDVDGDISNWRGQSLITEEGNIELVIYNGMFCAHKTIQEDEVTVIETDYQSCYNLIGR